MSLRLNLKIKKNYNIEENQNCNFWMLEENSWVWKITTQNEMVECNL